MDNNNKRPIKEGIIFIFSNECIVPSTVIDAQDVAGERPCSHRAYAAVGRGTDTSGRELEVVTDSSE